MSQWTCDRSALASAFVIPDVEIPSCRAGLARESPWVAVLGRSGRQLAQELGIRPESVYKGARRGQKEQARWRHVVG